jgi:hypothetical protein
VFKVLAYLILTIMGMYMGYVFAETPGLDPRAALICLAIYCGALALDVIEFRKFMHERGYI